MNKIANKAFNANLKKLFAAALALFACFALTCCSLLGNPEATPPPTPTPELPSIAIPTPVGLPEPEPAPTFSIATDRHDAIYNDTYMSAVYLGMRREDLEASFPAGPLTDNGYVSYDDYGFFVKYLGNDTIKEIVVFGQNNWRTFGGITCGTPTSDVLASYGDPLLTGKNTYSYYSLNQELLREVPSFINIDINYLYTITFIIESNKAACVMISKF